MTHHADCVVVDVLHVARDEVGVVFADVAQEDWNLQRLVVAQIEGM